MRHDGTRNDGLDSVMPRDPAMPCTASEAPTASVPASVSLPAPSLSALPVPTPQSETTALSSHYLWLIIGIPLAAFIIAVAPAMQERHPAFPFNGIIRGMAGLIIQALPFVLLGVVVSAAVETWVDADMITRHLPRRRSTAMLVAALSGAVVPVCDCVVAPTFSKLLRRGLPLPLAVTFLCAAPILNPVSLISTWYAFPHNHMMVVARAALGFATALVAGYSMAILPPRGLPLRARRTPASSSPSVSSSCPTVASEDRHDACAMTADFRSDHAGTCCDRPGIATDGDDTLIARRHRHASTAITYLRHIHDDFLTLMPLVLVGVAIATVVRVSLGDNPASGLSTTTTIVAMLVMMVFAYLGSICSSTDAVIAASLASVLPAPALLAFLVFGPMMDVKNTLMLMSECTERFTARLIATIALPAFLVCAITIPLTEGLL